MSTTTEAVKVLVHALIEAGCDIVAIGQGYVINEPEDADSRDRVDAILKDFGPRLHLLDEISNYLRSLDRWVEI